jgi:hypothetical protein
MKRGKRALIPALSLLALSAPALAGNVTVGSGSSMDLGTGSLALGCADLDVMGTMTAGTVGFTGGRDVTITPSGVMNGSSATLQLSGDWDNTGTFNAGTSTVLITDGCSLLSGIVNGSTSFNNLTLSTSTAKQVTFTAGSTQTVNGAFNASGASGFLLLIRSTVNGVKAFLNVQGTSSTSYVDVQDNSAVPGNNIALDSSSIKGSNTPGWLLSPMIPLLPPLAAVALGLALLALARRGLLRGRGAMQVR